MKDINKLKYWCSTVSYENHAQGKTRKKWTVCRGCCVFCNEKNCPYRRCEEKRKEDLCCWRRTPTEWMLERVLGYKVHRKFYQLRRVEYWLKIGRREGDGTWEGSAIKALREIFGKDFGRRKDVE